MNQRSWRHIDLCHLGYATKNRLREFSFLFFLFSSGETCGGMGEVKRAKVLHTSLPHSLPVRKSLHQFLPFEYWGEGEQKMVRAVRLSGGMHHSLLKRHTPFPCLYARSTIFFYFLFNVVTLQSFPFVAGSRRLYAVCTSIACWRVFNWISTVCQPTPSCQRTLSTSPPRSPPSVSFLSCQSKLTCQNRVKQKN